MKSRVKQTLQDLNKRTLGDPHSKLYNGRLKQQQMLDRHANRISHRQMLKDPTYRSMQRLQSPEAKLRRSSVVEGKKIVNLLKDTRLKHVDNLITYSGMDLRSRLQGVRLPKLTVECFYEQLLFGRLDSLQRVRETLSEQLNEVMPLLYVCLKLDLASSDEPVPTSISSLAEFLDQDADQVLLGDISY